MRPVRDRQIRPRQIAPHLTAPPTANGPAARSRPSAQAATSDPRAAADGRHHNRGMLSKTPHLTRLGHASSAHDSICHRQLIPEQNGAFVQTRISRTQRP
jgi:hypothetical protein